VDVCECMWMHVYIYGCMWMHVDVCGCMWMYVNVCGCMWMCSMDVCQRGKCFKILGCFALNRFDNIFAAYVMKLRQKSTRLFVKKN